MTEPGSAVDKLESQEVARRYNEVCQFLAEVYVKLLCKNVDAFGEDVLDIAERAGVLSANAASISPTRNENMMKIQPA